MLSKPEKDISSLEITGRMTKMVETLGKWKKSQHVALNADSPLQYKTMRVCVCVFMCVHV